MRRSDRLHRLRAGYSRWIREIWHPDTRPTSLSLDDAVRWIGVKILATEAGGPLDQRGIVEFVARYKVGGRAYRLCAQWTGT